MQTKNHSAFECTRVGLQLCLAVTLVCQLQAGAAAPKKGSGGGGSAESLYAKKDYQKACNAFYKKILANPNDAASCYYLGNCYVALKNYTAAIEAYRKANDLAPSNTIGAASREAINSIDKILHPPGTVVPAEAKKAEPAKDDEEGEKGDKDAKKDPRVVAAETAAQAKIADGEKAASKIMDEASNRCKPIKAEEDATAAEIQANQGRMANTEGTNQVITDARSPYEEQIKRIMDPAKARAQQIRDAAKQEADRIKQDAVKKK